MSIIVGFMEMTYFAKLANLAEDSLHVKVWQNIEMRQRKRRIDSWRFSRNWQIKENGQWTRIHERFGKTSIEVTKRGILTNGDYKKTANLGENEISGKWRVQGFGQIQMT